MHFLPAPAPKLRNLIEKCEISGSLMELVVWIFRRVASFSSYSVSPPPYSATLLTVYAKGSLVVIKAFFGFFCNITKHSVNDVGGDGQGLTGKSLITADRLFYDKRVSASHGQIHPPKTNLLSRCRLALVSVGLRVRTNCANFTLEYTFRT